MNPLEIKPIKTDEDYQNAVAAVWQLMDAEPGGEDANHIEASTLQLNAANPVLKDSERSRQTDSAL
jgi:antitoxin component HigA of HigAB toxin-antitoxin module